MGRVKLHKPKKIKKPRQVLGVSGVTADNVQQYLREVDAYVARLDPASKLLDSLNDRVEQLGVDSLSEPERIYYAHDRFGGAIVNGMLRDFYATEPATVLDDVEIGLRAIGEAEMGNLYARARQIHSQRVLPVPHDEYDELNQEDEAQEDVAAYVPRMQEIGYIMDEYAGQQGLLPI
jgi:hypothetical protein